MREQNFRRALFVRLDRIGDLVLSLPTDQSNSFNEVDWWIPRGLSFVTEAADPRRSAEEFGKDLSLKKIFELARRVREKRYDLAVIFHAPWWASYVLWLARVPVRIGVISQWHSFLFFNRGVRQKRSRAETSELEYNYRLLEEGLGLEIGSLTRSTLKLNAKSGPPAAFAAILPTGDYYVVHPGMGGSALNWPTDHYAALIETLAKETTVAITGTASDEVFLAPLKAMFANSNTGGASKRIVWLEGKLSGTELIAVLQNAKAVVAPSTGVLHLAASTGVPTLGLFSQIKVQRAVRWGPQGERTAVVESPVGTENAESMSLITVDNVLAKLRILLN